MKRSLFIVGVLLALVTPAGRAQTRVQVSLSFGEPYAYYPRYVHPYFYPYRPLRLLVVEPRYYREPRIIVVRPRAPRRYYGRRHYRGW